MKFRLSSTYTLDASEKPYNKEGLRGCFMGAPGSGKSFIAAITIEQWLDQGGVVVIFQPIAEWHTLKQAYPIQVVGGPHSMDVPLVASEPDLYARAVVENGISMIFYTRDVEDEEDLVKFVYGFIHKVMDLQQKYKRPLMIVLEEAHEYAPTTTQGHIAPPWVYNRMIKALVDLHTQGRKLNICPLSITQRPQLLNFTIRQLCNLVLFGRFSPQDAKYIDQNILTYYRKMGVEIDDDTLIGLETGEFFVIANTSQTITVDLERKTPHGADTPELTYVQPVSTEIKEAISDLGEKLREMIQKRGEEQSELEKAKRQVRTLEGKLSEAQEKAQLGVNLRELLKAGSAPDKVEVAERIQEMETKHQTEIAGIKETWTSPEDAKEMGERLTELEKRSEALDLFAEVLTPIIEPIVKRMMPMPTEAPVSGLAEKDIRAIIQKELASIPKSRRIARASGDTGIAWIDMWLPKMNSAEQKILRFMASKFPLKMTKSQIALSIGLTAKGGHFSGSFNNLVKNKLIIDAGGGLFVLAEAPP